MALSFPNVSVLSAVSNSEFFGEQFRYKSILQLRIEGSFQDLTAADHQAIHTAIENYESSAFGVNSSFTTPININSVAFGNGYITNFSTSPDGTDVGFKKYTVSITIPVNSNTQNFNILNIQDFNGINFSSSVFKNIQSFTESSVFTKGEGIQDSYSQNISLTILPENRLNVKTLASNFITNFLDNNRLSSLISSSNQYNNTNILKQYEQSYDEKNGSFSVNSKWLLSTRSSENQDDVIVITNRTLNYDESGIIKVTEDGSCTGNSNTNSNTRSLNAISKVRALLNNAFNNCRSLVDSKHNPLINHPISKNFTSIPFEGKATYSITFTNSKEVIENVGYWTNNIIINQTEGGDYTGNESGEIIGKGELSDNKAKYNYANNYWNSTIKNGIQGRINSYIKNPPSLLVSSQETHSEIEGKLSYDYSYTNNKSLIDNQNIRKIITSVTEDYDRSLFSTFNIVNHKEIAQIRQNKLQNNIVVKIVMNGKFTNSMKDYISKAKSIATKYKKGQLLNVNYNFSPVDREFNADIHYFYMP